MIVFLASRLAALLYGLAWPLDKFDRSNYAALSTFEILFETVILIIVILVKVFGEDEEAKEGKEGGAE